jgi:hypothetical protein
MMNSIRMHAYDTRIPVDDAIVMGIPACHEEIPFGGCDIKYGPDETEYYQQTRWRGVAHKIVMPQIGGNQRVLYIYIYIYKYI